MEWLFFAEYMDRNTLLLLQLCRQEREGVGGEERWEGGVKVVERKR